MKARLTYKTIITSSDYLSVYSFTDLTVVWVHREKVDYDTFVSIQQQQVAEKKERKLKINDNNLKG